MLPPSGVESAREETSAGGGQIVTPWEVQGEDGGIDYNKLLKKFGCSAITATLIKK